jgi:hypothetical protein
MHAILSCYQAANRLRDASETEQGGCDQKRIDEPIDFTPPLHLVLFHHPPP